jgi:hypothetical protein
MRREKRFRYSGFGLLSSFELQYSSFPLLPLPNAYGSPRNMNISIHYPLACFQEKNFIMGQKSLQRKELTAILITFINRPHFGSLAGISKMT